MRAIGYALQSLGVLMVLIGLLTGLYFYEGSKTDKASLNRAEKAYATVYSNGETETNYITAKNLYMNDMRVVGLWGGLGLIGGLIGIGAGSIIMQRRPITARRPLKSLNKKTQLRESLK